MRGKREEEKLCFKASVLETNLVKRRPFSKRLHQRHISTDGSLQDYLLFLKDNCFVPAHVVLVANCDGRKREILDREVCTLQHSHGRTGLIPCPDVRRCVQCSGDGDGAQDYPDEPASSKQSIRPVTLLFIANYRSKIDSSLNLILDLYVPCVVY